MKKKRKAKPIKQPPALKQRAKPFKPVAKAAVKRKAPRGVLRTLRMALLSGVRKKKSPKPADAPPKPVDVTPQQNAFLAAFRTTCSVRRAAEAAKIVRTNHYRWLEDAQYAAAFEHARAEAAQVLEDEAIRRAHEGTMEPVYYQGEEVGGVLRYSDGLMMFLLRGLRPERYRDRHEVSGPGGGPIEVEIVERLNRARNRLALEPHAA